jgi:hypothetical protein
MTYEMSKHIACLNQIYDNMHWINDQMGWDGMFETDFETALAKLGNVLAASVTYSLEDKYEKDNEKEES